MASFISNSPIGKPLFLKGPKSRKKASKRRCMYWSPQPKKWPVLSATHILGSRFLKGPQSRKRASKRLLVAPSQKVASFISKSHIGSRFFEGTQIPKKGLQKVPGRPKPKSGQFYQQLTYWEAAFLKGPKSRKKGSKKLLVAPSQKVASFITNSQIGKPLF